MFVIQSNENTSGQRWRFDFLVVISIVELTVSGGGERWNYSTLPILVIFSIKRMLMLKISQSLIVTILWPIFADLKIVCNLCLYWFPMICMFEFCELCIEILIVMVGKRNQSDCTFWVICKNYLYVIVTLLYAHFFTVMWPEWSGVPTLTFTLSEPVSPLICRLQKNRIVRFEFSDLEWDQISSMLEFFMQFVSVRCHLQCS